MAETMKTIDTVDPRPFKKLIMTIGELPTSFLESMTYYEMLAWFVDYLQNTIIPAVNNNAEALKELQSAFVTLKKYVDEYFDNLDVQEEINNKLDAMVEDGTLTQLIAQFLSLNAVMSFPSVADMKLAQNLVNGSTIETYGFYNINDGGGAKYLVREITNEENVDEVTLFALYDNTLVAELVCEDTMNVKQFGAKGDGVTDETILLGKIFSFVNTNDIVKTIVFPKGTYNVSDTIRVYSNINIEGEGVGNTTIKFTSTSETGANNHYLLYFYTASNLNVKNIKFEGAKNPTDYTIPLTQWWHGLTLAYSSNITIEKCEFDNFFTSGISIRNSSNILINDNDFSSNGWNDIAITRETDNIKITNNRFNNIASRGVNAEDGTFEQPCTNTLIEGNTFKTLNTSYQPRAINFANGSLSGDNHRYKNITISNNTINDVWEGMLLKFVKDVVITNNIFNCARAITGTSTNMTGYNENINVSNNIFNCTHPNTNLPFLSYNLPNSKNVIFNNNRCSSDVSQASINVTFYLCNDCIINNNVIIGGTRGLLLAGNNYNVTNNEIKDCSTYGISTSGSELTILNNKITNTGDSGIKLEGGNSKYKIEGNYLFNNTNYGIEFPNGSQGNKFAVIRNNWFGEDREVPVMNYCCYANKDVGYVVIENSYMLSNIDLHNGSHWLTNCVFRNNDGFGTLPA